MADGVSARVVDFSNVKDGGGSFNKKRVPAGDYLATITKVQDAESKKDESFQYLFTIKLNNYSQYAYPYYCKLQENQLWKLRNLLIAAGQNVPKKRMKLDPSKVVGKTIAVTMEDDEYEGKLQSVVAAVFPPSELSEGALASGAESEDDETSEDEAEYGDYGTLPGEQGGDEDEAEEETEDEDEGSEESGDEFDAMDRNALKAYIRERDAEFKIMKSTTDDALREKARELSTASASDEEDDELDELDIEDL